MVYVSAKTGFGIHDLKERMARLVTPDGSGKRLVADLVHPLDVVILVVPIDKAAPKGRLILPQQQTIRSLLDAGCIPVVTRETELARTLSLLREPPALVVTDSQAFGMGSRTVPDSVRLTSFSILFARYKGDLRTAVLGAAALRQLKDGDTVLISEGCTHHRQCGDIGTEKLPRWVRQYTGRDIRIVFTTGGELLAVIDGLYRPAEIWADGAHVYVGEVDGGVTIFDMDMQICAQLGFFYSSLIAHGLCGDGQGNLYIQTLWFQKSSNVMRLKRL